MNRYRLRTFGLELVMVGVAAAFFFPIYVLINISLKRPGDQSSPLAPARCEPRGSTSCPSRPGSPTSTPPSG